MQRVPADMNVLYLFSIKVLVLRLKQYAKEKTLRYHYTVEALVSDHLGKSRKVAATRAGRLREWAGM